MKQQHSFPSIVEITRWGPKVCNSTNITGPLDDGLGHLYFTVEIEEPNDNEKKGIILPKTIRRHFFMHLHSIIFEACDHALSIHRGLSLLLEPRLYKYIGFDPDSNNIRDENFKPMYQMYTLALINEPDLGLLLLEINMQVVEHLKLISN